MDIVLIVIAVIVVFVGLLGAVIPGLPGPPLSWIGLLLFNLTPVADHSLLFMLVMALLAVVITVLDYVVPSWGAKRYGGGKAGVWGCNIGLVLSLIGLPFGPQGLVGVFFWPFLGAYLGETMAGKASGHAFRAAWGTFLGMLAGTFIKLVYGIATLAIVVRDFFV